MCFGEDWGWKEDARSEKASQYGGYCSLCRKMKREPVTYTQFEIPMLAELKKEFRATKREVKKLEKEYLRLMFETDALEECLSEDDGTNDDMLAWELKTAIESDKERFKTNTARMDEIEKILEAKNVASDGKRNKRIRARA